MDCFIHGSQIDKIEWEKDGVKIVANSSQLDISNVKEDNAGKYKCIVYNGVIIKTSSEEILSVTCK